MTEDNVYPIREGRALFTPEIRKQIADRITPVTEKPQEVTDRVEEVLCTILVGFFRSLGETIGRQIGNKVGKAVSGKVTKLS